MSDEFVLLTEQGEMWAKMLMQVLKDNDIVCTALPVYGAGFAAKTGRMDSWKIYVPAAHLPQATQLLDELFHAEPIFDEEEE